MIKVHALHPNGWRIPAAFELLPGKHAVMYENSLSEMDSYGPFFPQYVLVDYDYELALRSAVLKVCLELLFVPAGFTKNLEPSRLLSDPSTSLFEYSRGMEQRFRFTCQLPKSNYMELSRMRQEGASHHAYEDRQHFNQTAFQTGAEMGTV